MVSVLPQGPSYDLFFDQFFTLLYKLIQFGRFGTGTKKINRLENCPFGLKDLKKEKRGAMTMATADNISVVAWKDTKVVTLASNVYSIHSTSIVSRVAKIDSKRRRINVECPKVISMYNSYMGRVNRLDQHIHAQRISFRGKKWWFLLFAFGIDASCQNAWNLYKKNHLLRISTPNCSILSRKIRSFC